MRVVAIVQARMGSTRLPGKVLRDLCGASMLARGIERLRNASSLEHIVIATTTRPEDDAIVDEAKRLSTQVYRGSAEDVLARYAGAARAANADVIVRITADCPLIDPRVVDQVVGALTQDIDYASNTDIRTFPRGLDCEVFFRDTLDRLDRIATSVPAREHVTGFIREQPALFRTAQLVADVDHSDLRWTVDTEDDFSLVHLLFERFHLASVAMDYRELVAEVRNDRAFLQINAHIEQKDWCN